MDAHRGYVVAPLTAARLADIAYAQSRHAAVTALTAVPPAQEGPWTLLWFANDEPNQALLARSAAGNIAIAIRGSIADPFQPGFWSDWFDEDAEARHQEVWPWAGAPVGVKISRGTLLGMHKLLSLGDGGLSLIERVTRLGPVGWITVAGHSLGAALAGTLACYLSTQIASSQARFAPITFAAPAIGNDQYAHWLEADFFSSRYRFHNTLDIVPHAWAGLGWIEKSYPGGPKLDPAIAYLVGLTRNYFAENDIRYRQPGSDQALVGKPVSRDDWFFEAGTQHSLDTYVALLQGRALTPPPAAI